MRFSKDWMRMKAKNRNGKNRVKALSRGMGHFQLKVVAGLTSGQIDRLRVEIGLRIA